MSDNIYKNKMFEASLNRIEVDKAWRGFNPGRIVNLKITNSKDYKSIEGKFKHEKYKIIQKIDKMVLMEKVSNGRKESFSFGDFMSGDVSI